MGLVVVVLVGMTLGAALWWAVFAVLDGEDRRRELNLRGSAEPDRAELVGAEGR